MAYALCRRLDRCLQAVMRDYDRIVAASQLVSSDDGTYGICEMCGRAIAPARLEARTTATRCVSCAGR